MSAIYNLEPQPTGSAIIHTTLGEISVELFAKQTPLACRNFLQLALDGYYDGTIFHRLVPNFILQGGDPTGTGNGGESIFDGGAFSGDLDPWPMDERRGRNAGPQGVGFKDEFHSRLRFNRRGLLGAANEGHKDTNGSQFFFTLDKTEELNGKNTMFGRVAGDTIYNLAKIGELDVDAAAERPLYPVKVEKIEVLVNPFEDMKKRERTAKTTTKASAAPEKKEKKKRKGGKQLLSFGGDEEGDEEMPVLKKTKFDTRIVMADENEEEEAPKPKSSKAKGKERRKSPTRGLPTREAPLQPTEDSSEAQISKPPTSRQARNYEDSPEPEPEPEPAKPEKTALERANEEMAALKASMRRNVHVNEKRDEPKKSALESMIPESSMRARKRRPGQVNATPAEEQEAMKLLKDFQSRLERVPPPTKENKEASHLVGSTNGDDASAAPGAVDEEAELCDLHFIANCQSCTSWDKEQKDDASDDENWMSHALTFAADRLGKDLTNRRKAEEELVVIDPRDRARTIKEEKRSGKAGSSSGGRAWDQGRDQARNAKLAKAASLGGRGAR